MTRTRHSTTGPRLAEYSEACTVRGVDTMTHSDVLARFGHALSDPTRVRSCWPCLDGAAYPSDLAQLIGASRQGVSNHLACLRGCGCGGGS